MAGQREQIGRQLRALYQAGTDAQVRTLLSQADAATILRNLRYYEYLYTARRDKIQVYVDTAQKIDALEQDVADTLARLQADQAKLEQEQAALLAEQAQRRQLAAEADAELQRKGTSLEKLQQDRTALQKVIERIEQQRALAKAEEERRQRDAEARARQEAEARRQQEEAARQAAATPAASGEPGAPPPTPPEPASPPPASAQQDDVQPYTAADLKRLQAESFTQRKGRMPWPARGKVMNRFGEVRQGSVTWDGLRIGTTPGSEVRAIHGGRVMYADWLRGQGMLVVLDHGNGYMSLYAHNDSLLRRAGEWVKPGDAIARAGNSGGEQEPGLYFEIRHNGEPVNPQPWLTPR